MASFKNKALQSHRATMGNVIPEGCSAPFHSPGRTSGIELLESWMWLWDTRTTVPPGGHLWNADTEEQDGSLITGGIFCIAQSKGSSQALPHFLPALSLYTAPQIKTCSSLNTDIAQTGRVQSKTGSQIQSASTHLILETLAGLNLTAEELFSPA